MRKIEASVVIDCPAEAVWNFISDWSNAQKWMPDALEVRQTSAGPLGVGTTLQSRWSSMSPGASLVTECEPGRKITLLTTSPQMIKGTRESISLENVEGKTKLNSVWELKFNSAYRLVGPLLVGRIRRSNDAMVGNVKRIMESDART
jgi:carbon monoxide dehydrogenase subunit G